MICFVPGGGRVIRPFSQLQVTGHPESLQVTLPLYVPLIGTPPRGAFTRYPSRLRWLLSVPSNQPP